MGTTIRRLNRTVQKAAKAGGLKAEDRALAEEIVLSIARTGTCLLSEVARQRQAAGDLIEPERELSEQLADEESSLDRLRVGWLLTAAPTVRRMPFITVDGSDVAKVHGRKFEHLDWVRDASDPDKRIVRGYWLAQIDALAERNGHLPLWSELFSTKAPEFKSWWDAFLRPIVQVLARLGREHTWLFDRGFDAIDVLKSLMTLQVHWVVRQVQQRNVVLGNGDVVPMHMLAAGLNRPHSVEVPYIDKRSHKPEHYTASFGFAPVRLPEIDAPMTMIVVHAGRDEDIDLLTNAHGMSADEAAQIVLAYMRRWGSEEATRAFKQLTGVEGFRVRKWTSIRRMAFLAMFTAGIEALILFTRPTMAEKYIARVKHFIADVLLRHYRLWRGIADALAAGT